MAPQAHAETEDRDAATLDTALEQASPGVKTRFTQFLAGSANSSTTHSGQAPDPRHAPSSQHTGTSHENAATADAQRRLNTDPHIDAALDWLDRSAGWAPGASRGVVASRLARLNVGELHDRSARRRRVNQRHIARALGEYYCERITGHGQYTAHYGRNRETATSILTCPDWLDLDCPLLSAHDGLSLADIISSDAISLDEQAADHAAQRLVETLAMGTRLVDTPLYRLLNIDVKKGRIVDTAGVMPFVQYALTMDYSRAS